VTLTEEQIAAAYAEIAERLDLPVRSANVESIRAALALAKTLVTEDPASEAAAMFYAFARHPRAFPRLTRVMTVLVATTCGRSHGIVLGASDANALERLVFLVSEQRISFEQVLDFFRTRMGEA
jgi:hypothetical protein